MFENELGALEALYESIVSLPETIASALVACFYLLLYPFVVLINLIYSWVADVVGSYLSIIDVVQACASDITGLVTGAFGGAIPSVWVALMLATIALNVAIRIYKMIKGVSIFGWSL